MKCILFNLKRNIKKNSYKYIILINILMKIIHVLLLLFNVIF